MFDTALAEIAEKIQLSPTKYEKATERYKTIASHLCDVESNIAKFSPHIYPQGSFRIHSTISNSDDKDEFDIDLILELEIDTDNDPDVVLDSVYNSLNRGRYKGKAEKKRRCVQVQYSDMHLDVTPAILLSKDLPTKPSQIFDCHPEREDHVKAAPEGFALWFDERILPRELLEKRALAANASIDPVPEQKALEEKPPKLIVLQLIKRWRDMQENRRAVGDGIEKIPSILLSKYVAEYVESGERSLYASLLSLTEYLILIMSRPLGTVRNPNYPPDILTDRWLGQKFGHGGLPLNQEYFLEDLSTLKRYILELAGASNNRNQQLMAQMFGEKTSVRGNMLLEGNNFAQQHGYTNDKAFIASFIANTRAVLSNMRLGTSYEERPKWQMMLREFIGVTATIHTEKNGSLLRSIESGGHVEPGEHICFQAYGRASRPGAREFSAGTTVHWRITNTGHAAAMKKELRGEFSCETGKVRWEHAAYEGLHWVQAFLVDSKGYCVGQSERFCIAVM